MDSLHLKVKHWVGVDLYFVVLFQVHSKLQLVLLEEVWTSRKKSILNSKTHWVVDMVHIFIISNLFNFGDISNESLIVDKITKLLQLIQIANEVLSDSLRFEQAKESQSRNMTITPWHYTLYKSAISADTAAVTVAVSYVNKQQIKLWSSPTSAMTSARPGLHITNQRRGVIPLVLFWNFFGSISKKSLNLFSKGIGSLITHPHVIRN